MHIICENVLMLCAQNYRYQNQSILDETTACQSWLVFLDTVYNSDDFSDKPDFNIASHLNIAKQNTVFGGDFNTLSTF